MVNVHEKFPVGASNKSAYKTDGSDVRDATPEEMIRYRDANKHRSKKVDEKLSSSEPTLGSTVLSTEALPKARPVSARPEQIESDSSSVSRATAHRARERMIDSSRKGEDRDISGKREICGSERREKVAETVGEIDLEEADRRNMAEIQGRIEALKAARDLEIAHTTISELMTTGNGASTVLHKPPRKESKREKPVGKEKMVSSRGAKKLPAIQTVTEAVFQLPTSEAIADMGTYAAPVTKRTRSTNHATGERRPDVALSTLKFGAMDETRPCNTEQTKDISGVELGIALVASALGKVVPRASSVNVTTDMADCYVEMSSTRKKSKTPVSGAPPNSVESDVDRDDIESEIRLSRSDVHIKIPGEMVESVANVLDAGCAAEVMVNKGLSGRCCQYRVQKSRSRMQRFSR